MKTLSIIAIFATLTASAAWQIDTITDPMTDSTRYAIVTHGTQVAAGFGFKYTPTFCVRITPVSYDQAKDQLTYTHEAIFGIEGDGLHRGRSQAMIRFDKAPAETLMITASTDRRAGFFAPDSGVVQRAMSATNILLRYRTTLGEERTTRFTVSGLSEQIREAKHLYLKARK